jgi:hypothetical protein
MSSSSAPPASEREIDVIDDSATTTATAAAVAVTATAAAAAAAAAAAVDNTDEMKIDDEGIRSMLDGLDSSGRNASSSNVESRASNYQAFLRYRENNKPDGDSSEEEGEKNVEFANNNDPSSASTTEIADVDVASDTATDETTDADEEYNAYSALGEADDYGDFQGFEIDDNNEGEGGGFGGGKREFGAGVFDNDEEEAEEEAEETSTPEPAFVSIPPLSQDKIDKIKFAMSKFTLTMKPGLGTSALLEMVDNKRMRVGDEGIKKDDDGEKKKEEKEEK